MRHAVSLLALTSLTSSVLATPVPNKRTTKSRFSVKQKAQRERRPPQVVHRRTYLKYGVPVPDNVNQAAVNALAAVSSVKVAGNGTGSTDATPFQGDAEYLSTVTIDGTEMVLDFDSGSSDLYVPNDLSFFVSFSGYFLAILPPSCPFACHMFGHDECNSWGHLCHAAIDRVDPVPLRNGN